LRPISHSGGEARPEVPESCRYYGKWGNDVMRKTLGLVAVLTMLAACGGEEDPPKKPVSLKDITGEQLCAMVPRSTVEKAFDEKIVESFGGPNEHMERDSMSCKYVTRALMDADGMDEIAVALDIGTQVRRAQDKATTAEQALDEYMVDFDGETVAFTPVPGLGVVAGYAGPDLDVRNRGAHLVAIIESGDQFIEVITTSDPEGTQDQLEPIAKELVKGMESALGG
jgi:hypothetical protein